MQTSESHSMSIPVETASCGPVSTGNVVPILHEIRHALERLLAAGEQTVIDLRSIPMGPGDEEELRTALGRGELEAELQALGKSVVRETRYSGVWWVEHFNSDDQTMSVFVEVTHVPAILKSQKQDIEQGLEELAEFLTSTAEKAGMGDT